MSYFRSPAEYQKLTGNSFSTQCPSIKEPDLIQKLFKNNDKYWPKWADIVKSGSRLYWVNANN